MYHPLAQTYADKGVLLMTEQGFDMLANSELSFCGSYLQNYVCWAALWLCAVPVPLVLPRRTLCQPLPPLAVDTLLSSCR